MKSQSKRIDDLEALYAPPKDRPIPYLAIIKYDGTVDVSHSKEDDFTLPSEQAFRKWIEENEIGESEFLEVLVVNPQGKQPEVK